MDRECEVGRKVVKLINLMIIDYGIYIIWT